MTRDICYYDGWCGTCRRSTRVLRALDCFGRLTFRDMTADPTLPVSPDLAMTGMTMKTRSGRVLVGYAAVRRAAAQTIIAPLALLGYLPGVSHLAARFYARVAAGRARSCPVPAEGLRPPAAPGILPP
jgi:predicted DCC family thiol-disulfide oxidoreductase YuxK